MSMSITTPSDNPYNNNNNDDNDDDNDDSAIMTTSYQRVSFRDDIVGDDNNTDNDATIDHATDLVGANKTLRNFIWMSFLFSANHGCVVSCLALASSRFGTIGAWQSGILMFSYAASALLGATYVVKRFGPRNAMSIGMLCYCAYVACFYVATRIEDDDFSQKRQAVAYIGATIGGIGAGFLWTAQGTYFGLASQDLALQLNTPLQESTARLAGYFAFLYLSEEVLLRLLSSALIQFQIASWGSIFGIYTIITVLSTIAMPCIYDYPKTDDDDDEDGSSDNVNGNGNNGDNNRNSVFYKVTVALQLLLRDPKMKYMIGLNAVFGFVSAFLNSYVNGQVVPAALDDPDSKYVGLLTSLVSAVAAAMSLVFGRISPSTGNGPILIFGALCFGGVVLPFVVQPDASRYGWAALIAIYSLHGTGRATFEGTLRSTFADYFSYEKEGAFANIILQNGIASGVGYILTFALTCETPSRYCVEYSNGTLHDVLTFEFIALISVVVAIFGYLSASFIRRQEQEQQQQQQPNEGEEEFGDDTTLLEHN